MAKITTNRLLLVLALCVVAALAVPTVARYVAADTVPAMKVGVAASDVQVMESQLLTGAQSSTVTLLTATIHTTNPEDVQFSVTAECSIATKGDLTGISSVVTKATVTIWVEVDGVPVQVSPDQGDNGRVVFCNRDWALDLNDPGGFLSLYEKTKSANAFNWMLQNVGVGTHSIVVKGQLSVYVTGVGYAEAGVGRRTLIAEPAHLTNDATF
jgi:hypothetical protein